jgi:hypothetical protein
MSSGNDQTRVSSPPFATAREAQEAEDRTADETSQPSEDALRLSGREASAGRKLGAMRYVLTISLVAVVAIFAVLLLAYR